MSNTEQTTILPRHFDREALPQEIINLTAGTDESGRLLIRAAAWLAGKGKVRAASAILKLVADQVRGAR